MAKSKTLRELRTAKGASWTIDYVSSQTGIDRSVLSRLERGYTTLRDPDKRRRLAEALDVSEQTLERAIQASKPQENEE